jgi:thiol:disulfide interchange protein DsbD
MARLLALLILSAAGSALALPPPGSDGPSPDAHEGAVTARLVSEVSAVAAGRPFRLAVDIRMAEGWHTYWENGGDAGLPTTIEWTLPEGFEAGPILWPVPHRYEEAGDLVTFGYAGRVLLLAEITPPSPLDATTVALAARVDWLQCKDICIPGGADLQLVLDVARDPIPAGESVVRDLAAARAEVPQPATSVPGVAVQVFQSVDAIPPGAKAEVAVVFAGLGGADPAACEFFPRPSTELWMRDGSFRDDGTSLAVVVPVEVDASVAPGTVSSLSGVIRVPHRGEDLRLSFEVPVNVAEAGQAVRATGAPVFAGKGPFLAEHPAAAAAPVQAARGPSLLRFLVLAFLGGIILNVMPCVLPVVSLKILGFVSKADEHPGKIAKLGWTFGAGVVASFLALALVVVALKSAGEHIGWGFQFQNPAFVAALAAVVFVFALSLLGVFEVGAMTAIVGLGLAAKERKDYADAFFHGVLTTILATPCTAPMLGAAVAFAFSQPAPIIIAIFLSTSLGLAFPYVLLSMHPAWLRYVPRPGVWMERFKQGMGFLLLATLVWLVAVFGAQTGADGATWLLAFLLVLAFFAWLHGTFLDLTSSIRRVMLIWALTLAGVGAGYRVFLHDRLFAEPLPRGGQTAQLGPRVEVTPGGVRWEPFSTEYLDTSVREGRTVFLDFTADWCWTCKVNERTVLADAEVERMFHENGILALKGDWTRQDPEITEVLRRHDRAGVPFYAVYPAGRPEDVIVLPEIINKKLVLESLEQAGPSRRNAGV